MTTPTQTAEPLRVMSALIIRGIADDVILPEFRKDGGEVTVIWDPTVGLMKRIAAGETADVIFAIDWALDELAAAGRIDVKTRRPVAQAAVGVAVAPGAPRPDISTPERLKAALLATPSLVYSRSGASGIYFEKLIDRLGIGEAIRAKATVVQAGLTAEKLVSGEVALAIQQVSELLAVPGAQLVGSIPAELDATTDFSAAVFADARDPEAARRFIEVLLSPVAREAYIRNGLKPFFD
jgi:molybdate transport system substrate-binding protein